MRKDHGTCPTVAYVLNINAKLPPDTLLLIYQSRYGFPPADLDMLFFPLILISC